MLRRTLYLTLALSAIVPVAACEDTRTPTAIAAEWFRPYGQETVARCIIHLESGGNPNVTGSAGERGLMQIHPVHRRDFERVTGRPWADAYDPDWNGYYALALWKSSGRSWRPWSTHTRCGV